MHAPRKDSLVHGLMRSRYFFFALLLHVLLFLMIGTMVVFDAVILQEDFESSFVGGGDGGPPPPPPSPPAPEQATTDETIPVPTQPAFTSPTEVFATDNPVMNAPTMPVPTFAPTMNMDMAATMAPSITAAPTKGDSFAQRASAIRNMRAGWGRGTGTTLGSGKNTTAEFKAYIARYAQGDWSSTLVMRNNQIVGGSLPNLLAYTAETTRGKIRANVIPEPLRLDSEDIFNVKPPFIYFTGHKDFKLTDKEVENLRKYLIQGGCVWGDNGLAGKASRFDEAFRREMKRVLPDDDKQFETVPNSHPVFSTWFPMPNGVPAGMNYYQEPIEVVKIDGEIAVIYTLNNYSDMFRMVFIPGTKKPDTREGPNKYNITPREMMSANKTFYRNFEPEACDASFQLGLNIIVHLLTRFDEKLLLAPM